MNEARATRENRLLAALPPDERLRIARLCTPVELPLKMVMIDGDQPAEYVYFLTEGLASAVATFSDGSQIEAAAIGPEGCVGITEFLGTRPENTQVIQQIAGSALRMRSDAFRHETERCPAFREVLTRYAGLLLSETMVSAACNRLHEAEARCARWLLISGERLGRTEYALTHEFLATMVGGSRPAVSAIVGKFEAAGLLSQTRGYFVLENVPGLEEIACECLGILRRHLRDYISELDSDNGSSSAASG